MALLRARVHVRLDRGDRALEALRALHADALPVDEDTIAQMLTGAAYVRLGQKERGAALLEDALDKASHAHATVRAETLLQLGIAKFRLGAYDAADSLCANVGPDQDIVYAHSLEYRGWVAQARGEFALAAQRFREALSALASCRRRDRYVEAKSLYGLSALCPELLLTQDWSAIERRISRFDWSASGLARWAFWVRIASSMMCETTGDGAGARTWARRAERAAENDAYRVVALCRMAAVFRGQRQADAHAEFVERAREAYEPLDLRALSAELQQLPLYLAEEVAHTGQPHDADPLLAQYREIVLPGLKGSSGDVERYVAMERSIEAAVFEASGEPAKAMRAFTEAYGVLARLGYRRRASALALRLARLTGKPRYLAYAEEALKEVSPRFWMARELAAMRSGEGPAVTEAELQILRLLAVGKTYKEIAALRRSSAKTVGNHVQSLFRKFNVHSRGELTAEAVRRRVVALHQGHRAG